MSQEFSFTTTAEEVAAAFAGEIKGKNVLITGTSLNGLGFEAARVIAHYANLVIITGYDEGRLKLSADVIKKANPTANIYPLSIDLASLASVRQAADEVNKLKEPLHVLIHNAAIAFVDFKLSEDGFESHYATNHVGPFLLTKLLVPKLLASASPDYTPRVVFVSSAAHALPGGHDVDFAAFTNPDPTHYSRSGGYRQTKSANVLMGFELSKRSKGKLNAFSLHPGLIYTKGFDKDYALVHFQNAGILDENGKPVTSHAWKTIPQGAATTVAAAFDPSLNDKAGSYLADCQAANDQIAPHCADPGNAEKLWNITEKLIGESFSF
ncbi:short-chain dehydrogenase/reductase family protein [Favolaschia claudopus]|uniref:Short-chain dehydrogenase/reductase family protein n=1 Tax=Favolaschia claudopus TaxID=2862362 RepID=A0AAW0AFV6_9AGAR